jgi:hypothetical protein
MRIACLVGLVILAAGCAADESAGPGLPAGRQIAVVTSADPAVHLFAEPIRARLEIVVDREKLDPDRLAFEPRFLPYDVVEQSASRESRGELEVLRYEYVLRCLRIACIPEVLASAAGDNETGRGERQVLRLQPSAVTHAGRDGERRIVARAFWPELVSVSRIRESDVPAYGYVFKTSTTPLPEPDYRVAPPLLAAGLVVGALALLALPAALLVGWARRRRQAQPVPEPEQELTALERALLLVEWAREREDGAERREALEVLAVELDALAHRELSFTARALAWAAPSPSPAAADDLVRAVREADGHA